MIQCLELTVDKWYYIRHWKFHGFWLDNCVSCEEVKKKLSEEAVNRRFGRSFFYWLRRSHPWRSWWDYSRKMGRRSPPGRRRPIAKKKKTPKQDMKQWWVTSSWRSTWAGETRLQEALTSEWSQYRASEERTWLEECADDCCPCPWGPCG